MSHEINQLDIPDRQLQASTAQSKASTWTDIGEAQITYTIFGKAKVRIIRKHDNVPSHILADGDGGNGAGCLSLAGVVHISTNRATAERRPCIHLKRQ